MKFDRRRVDDLFFNTKNRLDRRRRRNRLPRPSSTSPSIFRRGDSNKNPLKNRWLRSSWRPELPFSETGGIRIKIGRQQHFRRRKFLRRENFLPSWGFTRQFHNVVHSERLRKERKEAVAFEKTGGSHGGARTHSERCVWETPGCWSSSVSTVESPIFGTNTVHLAFRSTGPWLETPPPDHWVAYE